MKTNNNNKKLFRNNNQNGHKCGWSWLFYSNCWIN